MSSRIFAWISLACFVSAISLFVTNRVTAADTNSADGSSSTVYVAIERAVLHSGPGDEYYPTGHVDQGTSLEVFHRTDDNWLGIRPPEGSFSWVPAADAYLLPGGRVIEIINPQAVSWIGTTLGSAKQYRWQVQLKAAEQLSVLGEQAALDADGKEVLWYKVSPPSGEFRWIRAKEVSSKPIPAAPAKKNASTPAVASKPRVSRTAAEVKSAQAPGASNSKVVTAAYQTAPSTAADDVIVLGQSSEYYDDSPMIGEAVEGGGVVIGPYGEGEIIEGEIIEGEYVDGEYVEGEYIVDDPHTEIYYDDSNYVEPHIPTRSSDPFNGWSAMSLEDDGLRFTFLERMFGRAAQTGPDPLADDPFDLSMNRGTVRANSPRAVLQMGPPPAASPYVESHAPGTRVRSGGWRDPRTLGQGHRPGRMNTPTAAPAFSSNDATSRDEGQLAQTGDPLRGFDLASKAIENARAKLVAKLSPAQMAELQRPEPMLSASVDYQRPPSDFSSSQPSVPTNNVQWYGIQSEKAAQLPSSGQSTGQFGSLASSQRALPNSNLDLSQLQLSLSEAVTQPMQFWSLQQIYDGTRYHVEHGTNPIERGQARLLMERIEEFAELAKKSGYVALNGAVASTLRNPVADVTTASSISGGNSFVRSDFQQMGTQQDNFDVTGWLVQVVAARPGQPSHAISDQAGNVFAYVSPVPGLNLDRYINQAVGITGLRGYLPQLQAAHIQAQRVVRLQ